MILLLVLLLEMIIVSKIVENDPFHLICMQLLLMEFHTWKILEVFFILSHAANIPFVNSSSLLMGLLYTGILKYSHTNKCSFWGLLCLMPIFSVQAVHWNVLVHHYEYITLYFLLPRVHFEQQQQLLLKGNSVLSTNSSRQKEWSNKVVT